MFPLSDKQLHGILVAALSYGGEYADVFLEDTRISEDRLARAVVQIAESAAVKDRAVCESQKRLAFPLLFPHLFEIVHISMLFRDCFP